MDKLKNNNRKMVNFNFNYNNNNKVNNFIKKLEMIKINKIQ